MVTATGWDFSSTKVRNSHGQLQAVACFVCPLRLHTGSQSDAGGEIVEISTDTHEVWLMQGSKEVFMERINLATMLRGDLGKSYAHW